jgi:hypothetical protein
MGVDASKPPLPWDEWLVARPPHPRATQLRVIGALFLQLAQMQLEENVLGVARGLTVLPNNTAPIVRADGWDKAEQTVISVPVPAPGSTTLDTDIEADLRRWLTMNDPVAAFAQVYFDMTTMEKKPVKLPAPLQETAEALYAKIGDARLRQPGAAPARVSTRFASRNRYTFAPTTARDSQDNTCLDYALEHAKELEHDFFVNKYVTHFFTNWEKLQLQSQHKYALFKQPITDAGPAPGRPPSNLGLSRLLGPISYTYMAPRVGFEDLPTIVLLGDMHTPETCDAPCDAKANPLDTQCASTSGEPNTFLWHLNTMFAGLQPDVFIEAWESQTDRRRKKLTAPSDALLPSPLTSTKASLQACLFGDRDKCPYKHLRAHVIDMRQNVFVGNTQPQESRDPTLETILGDVQNLQHGKLKRLWGFFYPEFTLQEVFTSVVQGFVDPSVYFGTNPFLQKYSRACHELAQLSPDVYAALKTHAASIPQASLLHPWLLASVADWLETGKEDSCLPTEVAVPLDQITPKVYFPHYDMDLYGIARALKVDRDGERKRLVVFFVGYAHCETIAAFIAFMYEIHRHVHTETKCLNLRESVRIMRSNQKAEQRAQIEGHEFELQNVAREEQRATVGKTFWLQVLDTETKSGNTIEMEQASQRIAEYTQRLNDLALSRETLQRSLEELRA